MKFSEQIIVRIETTSCFTPGQEPPWEIKNEWIEKIIIIIIINSLPDTSANQHHSAEFFARLTIFLLPSKQ